MSYIEKQSGFSGLGFSLKPPSWLVKDVKAIFGGAKTASVPTPGGPVTVSLPGGDSTATASPPAGVDSIPGGWLTLGAVGLGLLFMLRGFGKRRRR